MQRLSDRLKQPVVVENKPGASAQIAAELVAKAKPDGYTLFMTTNTSHSANPSLFKTLRYDPIKDFTPIVRTGELPFALAVNLQLPVTSTQELERHVLDTGVRYIKTGTQQVIQAKMFIQPHKYFADPWAPNFPHQPGMGNVAVRP